MLLRMLEDSYVEERFHFVPDVAKAALTQLASDRAFGRLFVIESDGKAAGYLAVTFGFSLEFGGRDAFVDELYVIREARGRGLGTAALEAAEQACREEGIGALHLEVAHENTKAKALYERHGFVEHLRHLMTKRLAI